VAKSKITKGALYYYFESKQELAFAVFEDMIMAHMRNEWLEPLMSAVDPVETLKQIITSINIRKTVTESRSRVGMLKLLLEISPLNAGFRKRVTDLNRQLLEGISKALRRGQEKGIVKSIIDVDRTAERIMTGLIGGMVLAKSAWEQRIFIDCQNRLIHLLESLRSNGESLPENI
jgi:AcrR family transcriptional regulator